MALPTNRDDFKDYCLRRLGAPTIKINVDDATIEDCIDFALRKYMDYHYDAEERVYYKHQITQEDMDSQSITLPDNVVGAVNVFSAGFTAQSGNFFSIDYRLALSTLYTFTANSLLPYYMTMYQIQSLQNMLSGVKPFRYNRNANVLHLDTNWKTSFNVGDYLIVEAYQVIDPDQYGRVFQEPWLIDYTCAQISLRWGKILTRYTGLTLPGGVQFNGDRILTDAQLEIVKLEEDLINKYTLPPMDFIG